MISPKHLEAARVILESPELFPQFFTRWANWKLAQMKKLHKVASIFTKLTGQLYCISIKAVWQCLKEGITLDKLLYKFNNLLNSLTGG